MGGGAVRRAALVLRGRVGVVAAAIVSDVPFGSVVAVTKLRPPELRDTLVPRQALLTTLDADPTTRLALVAGPAGAGKTTVVLQWHATRRAQQPFAWLALDPDDRDPVRFWGLVIAALRTVHDGFGARAAAALRAGRGAVLDAVVPELINEAAALPRTVLVLDDLHVLDDDAAVHESLSVLLEHLPPSLRIVVTTRTVPPLPIPRLRARGQLAEIDAADLRFSDRDAAAMLRCGFDIELADPQVARLQAHTEGWAAGLHLAGIRLRERGADFDDFISAFAAPQANVVDYLTAEVLDAQTPDVRAFLLQTSILDLLSGPLCEAVTKTAHADAILEDLGRRNMLVEPLDEHHDWWRCHQLFGDVLRRRARDTLGDEMLTTLHRRAADWHRAHGEPQDAIRHALAAGESGLAAGLVADHWEVRFNRGELTAVAGWLDALPETQLQHDPRLWLARLWTALDRGRLDEAHSQLATARDTTTPAIHAWGVVLHALHAFKRGDLTTAREGLSNLDDDVAGDPFRETVGQHVRGLVAYWEGVPFLAAKHFSRAEALAERDGNHLGRAYALGYLALLGVDAGEGDLARAQLSAVDALREEDAAIGEHFVASVAALALGRRLAADGAYEASVPALERAVVLAGRGAGRLEMAAALIALTLVHHARRRPAAAELAITEARDIIAACPAPGQLGERLLGAERELFGASSSEAADPARDELTTGELAVLAMLPGPLSQRQIGEALFISINTVKTHCRNIYAKLRAGSREQAVGRARELGLLP
jgi:LuxR family maltose regulon positive regulatory protein